MKILSQISEYRIYFIIILAGIGCFVFWDYAVEILIGLFGLGGAAIAAKKQKAKEAQIIADEHEAMSDAEFVKSVKEMNNAIDSQKEAVEIANKEIEAIKAPPGFKKKSIKSR